MTQPLAQPRQDPWDGAASASIETPTGKGAGDENFPVGSWLIAPALRPHVMAFYAFARAADDIADNPDLRPQEKIARLDAFEAGLDVTDGASGVAKAAALGLSLAQAGVSDRHARDLLTAFRQDAVKGRYDDWAELLDYCEKSANPVGRFLMDLHGEDTALWAPSDALCTVLQILNHLQDCQDDHAAMDRVYLPLDLLAEQGLGVDVLTKAAAPPQFRWVLDRILDRCEIMVATAKTRPARPRSLRLHAEMAVITALAGRLTARLRREDPLAGRVKLSKLDFAMASLSGIRALVTRRRG